MNLAVLAYFKYSSFFVAEFNDILAGGEGGELIQWTAVVLPIGISFFTFQKITYVVDVYRGVRKALTKFVDFALYVAMFPQLIAGPIVRYNEISRELHDRKETLDGFYEGLLRFSLGLVKKVVLANTCGMVADTVFGMGPSELDSFSSWLGIMAYTLQIYFDFSAYSDMAIGLGRIFGFHFPENFKRPYSAISITDFWRRWHITLSNFFRDYLYIPLGGNRQGRARLYFNLGVVFILCGLWHGANWTFIVWGLYHGLILIFERMTGLGKTGEASYVALRRSVTFLLVLIAWVFFRSPDMAYAIDYLSAMFVPSLKPLPFELFMALNPRNLTFLIISAAVIFLPRTFSGAALFTDTTATTAGRLKVCGLMVMVIYSIALLASGSYNPFIYFQF